MVVGTRMATCLPSSTALNACPQRHLGLAKADIAANQAVHGHGALHVAFDIGNCLQLVFGLLMGKTGFQFRLLFDIEKHVPRSIPLCIQIKQFISQLIDRFLRAAFAFVQRFSPMRLS